MIGKFFGSSLLALALSFAMTACKPAPPARLAKSQGSGNATPDPKPKPKPSRVGEPAETGEEPNRGGPNDSDSRLPGEPEPEVILKPLNETGGSDNNNAVTIPMPLDDSGSDIDPYKAPRMIMSENSRECLDLDGNTNRNGEVIQGRPCSGTTGQMIEIKKVDNNYVTLSFLASKGCWMLKNSSPEKRTILEQWSCDGRESQKWKIEKVSGNSYSIRPALNKNRCVDMDTNGPKVRSTLQIYDCLNNPQQTWTLVRKDKAFVPKAQPILNLDDICHHKIRVYENDTSAAGRLVYETLGGRLMDRVPEIAKEVCHVIYKKPEEVTANINYMSVFVESDLPGGIVAVAKAEGYKDSSMKFSAKQFLEKKNAGYDIAKFLKGVMAFELTHVFQYPLNAKANTKLKALSDALAYAIRVQIGYPDQSWKRAKGGSWDQGGLQTGLFLVYLEAKSPGFLYRFHAQLMKAVDEAAVMTAAGKSVDELWKGYLADADCSTSNLVCGK